MFTIVGSGFGLYGYLPALIDALGEPVILPRTYEDKVGARPELHGYLDSIRWVADADAALQAASGAVVATSPRKQQEVVSRCARLPALDTLLLEKPVAVTPDLAIEILDGLKISGKRYRIGYTLLHTRWSERLALPRAPEFEGDVSITWTFMAHHFAHGLTNWKRIHAEGGGVLRFFGVHLLALLARHGYREVAESALSGEQIDQPERWRAIFTGPGLPDCRVEVDSRSGVNAFAVALDAPAGNRLLLDLRDPFQLEEGPDLTQGADRRVGVLKRLLDTLRSDDDACHGLYDAVNLLWQKVEAASTFARR
jgi:predicted dehydrogenase